MSIEALRQAASNGNAQAQLQLGIALMTGQGVGADLEQGREWLDKAAASGDLDAARFLGMIYLRGMDVVPDLDRAIALLGRAAQAGDAESHWWLASYYGGARDQKFSPVETLQHLEQSAAGGYPRAMTHLAYALITGCLGSESPVDGMRWMIKAAAAQDPGAMLALAEYSEHGVLVPANHSRAAALARNAATTGWQVAAEYANSLGEAGPLEAHLLPGPEEVSEVHNGSLPETILSVPSWTPRVIIMRHLLSTFECAEIANGALEHLMPSFIVDADGQLGKHDIRTSNEVRLRPGIRNLVMNMVERRMADWSHFPLENGEYPLVLHYQDSQSFEQHYDYFIPEKFAMGEGPLEFGGQRVATQLVYLNDDFSGGETRFNNADMVVQPERGTCIQFYNVGPDHNVDPLTRHTGVAVTRGSKWLLSRWIREAASDMPATRIERDVYAPQEGS